MAVRSWTLADVDQNIQLDSLTVAAGEFGDAAAGNSVELKSLHGGLSEGVRLLEIDNGTLRVAILPDRGMGIWKAWHGETEIGWHSPVNGPVHPTYVPLMEPSGLGWLDGFDELLVRCGLLSNGAPEFDEQGRLACPLHGRIANLPAHKVDVAVDEQSGEITVTGVVDEKRFHFQKLRLTSTVKLRPGSAQIEIRDEVQNLSGNAGEMQLLYHVNFGPPVNTPGARLLAAVREMAPRNAHAANDVDDWQSYGPCEVGSSEQVYFFNLEADRDGRTRTLLKAADGSCGVSLCFDVTQLPCFTQWKNTPPEADGYVTGMEPGTNFPNPRSFEAAQRRVVPLAAGESALFELTLEVHPDGQSVSNAEAEIAALQNGTQPKIHAQPRPDWSDV